MTKHSIEVREAENHACIWQEDLSLEVPHLVSSARKTDYITFENPIYAAFAVIDYWNNTLLPHDNPRQVIAVFTEDEAGAKTKIWEGIHPEQIKSPQS